MPSIPSLIVDQSPSQLRHWWCDWLPGDDSLPAHFAAEDLIPGGDVKRVEIGSGEGYVRERAGLGFIQNGDNSARLVADLDTLLRRNIQEPFGIEGHAIGSGHLIVR